MRILVVGSGGREHAIVHALTRDESVKEIHAVPGNAGIAMLATCHAGAMDDAEAVVGVAKDIQADLVIIGPEIPLVAGVSDALRGEGFAVFGPSQQAAALEGSKAFAKDVMQAAGVATARAVSLQPGDDIEAALQDFGPQYVVKDDGLAAGKGVVVTTDFDAAVAHARAVHAAGNPVILESFLDGPEISLFCLVDGETVVPLLPAQDHKRAYDNDEGPNTGGMGAYLPLPWLHDGAVETLVDELVAPVAKEMVNRGMPYSGLLYLGAAWGEAGPAVVEFNARFGDPETQPLLALLKTPLGGLLNAVATGTLAEHAPLEWEDGYAVTVVVAAEGYPDSPRKGDEITGEGLEDPNVVLHAGTAREGEKFISAGGRVLNVLGTGSSMREAVDQAYARVEKLQLDGSFYRRDIAKQAL